MDEQALEQHVESLLKEIELDRVYIESEWGRCSKERGPAPSMCSWVQYERVYDRMRERNETPATYRTRSGDPPRKNTFYALRAAWTWGVLREMEAIAQEVAAFEQTLDKCDGRGWDIRRVGAKMKVWRARFDDLRHDYDRFRPDPERKNRNERDYVGDFSQIVRPEDAKRSSTSKKRDVGLLPDDWRAAIVEHALRTRSKYLIPICVLSKTGGRGAEANKGVWVSQPAPDTLGFLIRGAKFREGYQGQRWRLLTMAATGIEARILIEALRANGGRLFVKVDSSKNLSAAVTRIGAAALGPTTNGKPMPSISNVTFRHQLSADVKDEGLTDEEVARILGHCNTTSQDYYGRAIHGKGARRIKATTSGSVKHTRWDKTLATKPRLPRP